MQNERPSTENDDDEVAPAWTFDDVREELARDMTPALWLLSESTTAGEFHRRLAEIILDADKLSSSDREFLSDLVSKPWTGRKGQKGRRRDESTLYTVYNKCVVEPQDLGGAPLRPKDAHNLIISLFGWKGEGLEERARKVLDRAVKFVEGRDGAAHTDKIPPDLCP